MRRSEINRLIMQAETSFLGRGLALPPWAAWEPAEWRAHPEEARFCAAHQMGWDITDFGSDRFAERGLVLLCTRNGIAGRTGERTYAEKLMIVREAQETPFHCHRIKTEDIINRGGGVLVVEVMSAEAPEAPASVLVDGSTRTVEPHTPIRLAPGESITLFPGQMHRFYGEPGRGEVVAGEVSQVNDDLTDNIFLETVGRFATIEEDEPVHRPLWSELAKLIAG